MTVPTYDIGCVPKNSLTTVIFSAGNIIPENALAGCETLKSVTMPHGITEIKSGAFEGCSSLTSIALPFSVESIGEKAFYESGLTKIYLYDAVTSVGANAFGNCAALGEVRISSYIGEGLNVTAFSGCDNITTAELPTYALEANVISLKNVVDLTINNYALDENDVGVSLNVSFLAGADNLKNLTIGRGVTAISDLAGLNAEGIALKVDDNNPVFEVINNKIVLRNNEA